MLSVCLTETKIINRCTNELLVHNPVAGKLLLIDECMNLSSMEFTKIETPVKIGISNSPDIERLLSKYITNIDVVTRYIGGKNYLIFSSIDYLLCLTIDRKVKSGYVYCENNSDYDNEDHDDEY